MDLRPPHARPWTAPLELKPEEPRPPARSRRSRRAPHRRVTRRRAPRRRITRRRERALPLGRVLASLFGALLLCALGYGWLSRALPADRADFRAPALNARLERLRPEIELALGEEIGPMRAEALSLEDMAEVLATQDYRARYRTGAEDYQYDSLRGLAGATCVLGTVDGEGEIKINERLVRLHAEHLPALQGRLDHTLDAILIHEAVHVWQHRQGYTAAWAQGTAHGPEELQARLALAEGQAELVTRRVCERLGYEEVFQALQPPHPSSAAPAERAGAEAVYLRYVQGERLYAAALAEWGDAGPKRALKTPPWSKAEVEDPSSWLERANSPNPQEQTPPGPAFERDPGRDLAIR